MLLFWIGYLLPKTWRKSPHASQRAAFLLAGSCFFCVLIYLASYKIPILTKRTVYYFLSLPYTCLSIAGFVFVLPKVWRRILMIILLLGIIFSLFSPIEKLITPQPHLKMISLINSAHPDFIALYTADHLAQELNAIYYNGLKDLGHMAIWNPRKEGEPAPNPPFRHLIGEQLTTMNQIPSALKKKPLPNQSIVMIEESIDSNEKDIILNSFSSFYSYQEILLNPKDDKRSYTIILFANPKN